MKSDDWIKKAKCIDFPLSVMFPPSGANAAIRYAKSICDGCPVINECIEDEYSDVFLRRSPVGIRGGMGVKEREYLYRAWNKQRRNGVLR